MHYIVTAKEMKSYDANTIEVLGIPSLVLMERAALCVCEAITSYLDGILASKAKVLVLCGSGNNGADGLAVARLMSERNVEAVVCELGDEASATPEYKKQKEILTYYDVSFCSLHELEKHRDSKVIVDAVFGIGLKRDVAGEYAYAIESVNTWEGYRIAVDIASGISADNGKVLGVAFRADETVTFAYAKRGQFIAPGKEYTGRLTISDIGITDKSFLSDKPEAFTYDKEDIESLLPKRDDAGNKGTFGKVLVIAGFENMAGAAVLCAKAALTMGAGMVKVISAPENKEIIIGSCPELLYGTCEDLDSGLKWADVVVIGPGLGSSPTAREMLEKVLSESELPVVVDADGINMISMDNALRKCLDDRAGQNTETILTPHVGELSRLSGFSVADIKDSFMETVKNLAEAYGVILVGKDARSVVAGPFGKLYLNVTGNSGMATAGSGDVLAGIIGALLAQRMDGFDASALGVYIHSLAGDAAARKLSEYGVTASKIIENIKEVT